MVLRDIKKLIVVYCNLRYYDLKTKKEFLRWIVMLW